MRNANEKPGGAFRLGVIGTVLATLAICALGLTEGSIAWAQAEPTGQLPTTYGTKATRVDLTQLTRRAGPLFPVSMSAGWTAQDAGPVKVHQITVPSRLRTGQATDENRFYFSAVQTTPRWEALLKTPWPSTVGLFESDGTAGQFLRVKTARGTPPQLVRVEVGRLGDGAVWPAAATAKRFSLLMSVPLSK